MFCKIVVPLDGSAAAEAALVPAMFMARAFQAAIQLVAVPEGSAESAEIRVSLESYICEQAHKLRQESCEVSSEMLDEGPAYERLLEHLEKEKPDLLILTSHGRSGVARLLMGSVAESLCRTAPCPVFVVGRQSRLFQNAKVQAALGS